MIYIDNLNVIEIKYHTDIAKACNYTVSSSIISAN